MYGKCLAAHTNCNFPMVNSIQAVEKWLLPESSTIIHHILMPIHKSRVYGLSSKVHNNLSMFCSGIVYIVVLYNKNTFKILSILAHALFDTDRLDNN